SAVREILAVVLDRLARVRGGHPEVTAEGELERWADQPLERVRIGHGPAALAQRVLDRARDARLGIGERAVQVEQDRLGHCSSSRTQRRPGRPSMLRALRVRWYSTSPSAPFLPAQAPSAVRSPW